MPISQKISRKKKHVKSRKNINPINRNIYVLWLGDEKINAYRRKSMNNLPKNSILITKKNLYNYILPNYPLHPSYEYLSTIHKSDYLRCYLMYHYGGGYSDVKVTTIDWDYSFDKMEENKNIWMMGVKTTYPHTFSHTEEWDKKMKNSISMHIDKLFCMGFFICRPKTPMVTEWYNEVNKRLDTYLPALIKNPAKYTRECFDKTYMVAFDKPIWENPNKSIKTNYPITWNILLAQILYPLEIKYIKHIDNTTMVSQINIK